MDDKQFDKFINALDYRFDTFRDEIKAEIRQELTDIKSNIDHLVDMTDTDEKERLAMSSTIDRTLDSHERRLTKLELAAD